MNSPMEHHAETRPIRLEGTCPSCNTDTYFDLLGLQYFPQHIAYQLGIHYVQTLWQCTTCDTTLSDSTLEKIIASQLDAP